THVLPASFAYASKPAWYVSHYGTPPFPPIGPDVSGGDLATLPSGIAYRTPARLCYENTAQDSTNYPATAIIAFDANVCYASGGSSPIVTFTPSPLAFGQVPVGATGNLVTLTITNTGTANLTVSALNNATNFT